MSYSASYTVRLCRDQYIVYVIFDLRCVHDTSQQPRSCDGIDQVLVFCDFFLDIYRNDAFFWFVLYSSLIVNFVDIEVYLGGKAPVFDYESRWTTHKAHSWVAIPCKNVAMHSIACTMKL